MVVQGDKKNASICHKDSSVGLDTRKQIEKIPPSGTYAGAYKVTMCNNSIYISSGPGIRE